MDFLQVISLEYFQYFLIFKGVKTFNKMPETDLIPATEAAKEKGCSTQSVYNALARGDLNEVRMGSHRLVKQDNKYKRFQVKETGGRKHNRYQQKRIA